MILESLPYSTRNSLQGTAFLRSLFFTYPHKYPQLFTTYRVLSAPITDAMPVDWKPAMIHIGLSNGKCKI